MHRREEIFGDGEGDREERRESGGEWTVSVGNTARRLSGSSSVRSEEDVSSGSGRGVIGRGFEPFALMYVSATAVASILATGLTHNGRR